MSVALDLSKLPVFPIRIFKADGQWKKVPALEGWRGHAGLAPNQIEQWWRGQGRNTFGIELEKSGLIVIDADRHKHGVDGVQALTELVEGKAWPVHPIVRSAGDGEHHIFRQPAEPLGNGSGGLPVGVDVRGAGGWIVAPGTLRPDGKAWRLVEDHPAPLLPSWIEEIIRGKKGARGTSGTPGTPGTRALSPGTLVAGSGRIHQGNLPKPLYLRLLRLVPLSDSVSRHDQRRVAGILGTALRWHGHRNDGLNWAAWSFRGLVAVGTVAPSAAQELLISVTRLNGYLEKDGMEAVLATIASGLGEVG
jgi:hypothetical protein